MSQMQPKGSTIGLLKDGKTVQEKFDNLTDGQGVVNLFNGYLTRTQINNAINGIYTEGLSSIIESAAKIASDSGKLLYIPAGHYLIDRQTNHYGCIVGAGIGKTIFHIKPGPGGASQPGGGLMGNGVNLDPANPKTCILRDFTITSTPDNFFTYDAVNHPSTLYDDSTVGTEGHIRSEGFDECEITNIESLWCRGFAITVTLNKRVYVQRNRIINSMRDAIRAGGCEEAFINKNTIKHCGDNAISAGTFYRTSGSNTLSIPQSTARSCIVSNNLCIDAAGIAVLGATTTLVESNIIVRNKSLGIIAPWGGDLEGASDSTDLVIQNNIITDIISAVALGTAGASNIPSQGKDATWNSCIILHPRPPSATPGLAVPGTFDYTNKVFVKPENFYLTNAGVTTLTVPMAGVKGLRIVGNKFVRSLPNAALFSSLGLGKVFTPTGWVDPVFNMMLTGYGIITRTNSYSTSTSLHNANIKDNEFYGLDVGVNLDQCTIIYDLNIDNNKFIRNKSRGIKLTGQQWSSSTHLGQPFGYISISRNVFDLDPYLEHSSHKSDGTWNTPDDCTGIDRAYTTGLIIQDNTFRNCSSGVSDLNSFRASANQELTHGTGILRNNTWICQPADNYDGTVSGSVNNKGIRLVPIMTSDNLIIEDSNPQSSTYLKTLGGTGYKSADTYPLTGWWPKGLFLHNIAPVVKTENIVVGTVTKVHTYIVNGWFRVTSNSSNTLGTDWVESRCTISIT